MSIKNSVKRDHWKLIAITIVVALVIFLLAALAVYMYRGTGGLGAPSTITPAPVPSQEQQQLAPPKGVEKEIVTKDLTGKWMGHVNETAFTVVVENETVTIKMTKSGSSLLYWYGSFSNQATVGETINSMKLDINKAVLSGADSKEFTVNENSLAFDVSALGRTATVEVTRAST